MQRAILTAIFCTLANSALAQNWGNLDALITSQLTRQAPVSSTFMPDAPDPSGATRAMVIAHTHITGSAGSTAIHVGYFVKQNNAWFLARRIEGLFGLGNENPLFQGNLFEVTTSTLGPNDPRCCPSQKTRWQINLDTGGVAVVN